MIAAMVMSLLIYAMTKFSKTSNSTLTGTVRLEAVIKDFDEYKNSISKDMARISDEFSKGFDKIEKTLDIIERENRENVEKMWDRLDAINTQVALNRYRLDRLENHNGNQKEKGRGAV